MRPNSLLTALLVVSLSSWDFMCARPRSVICATIVVSINNSAASPLSLTIAKRARSGVIRSTTYAAESETRMVTCICDVSCAPSGAARIGNAPQMRKGLASFNPDSRRVAMESYAVGGRRFQGGVGCGPDRGADDQMHL